MISATSPGMLAKDLHSLSMESNPNQPNKSKPNIILLTPPEVHLIHQSQFSLDFNFVKAYESPLSLPQFLAEANAAGIAAMFATPNGPPITAKSVLRHIPSLRCIVTMSAGTDYIDLAECRHRGIAVANAGDYYSDDCADMAVGLLFDVLRKISAADRYVRSGVSRSNGEYEYEYPLGNRLGGKRVGIIGYGSIGSGVATRLEAFGCYVSYTSRQQKQFVSYPFYSNVTELANNNDVLIVCCALTNETKHIINKDVLYALGKEGIVINIGRGAIVDEHELVSFLAEGKIAGAGLDVFEEEPIVPEVLFALDNVVLSPHHAGFAIESFRNVYECVTANFKAFFAGKPLLSPV